MEGETNPHERRSTPLSFTNLKKCCSIRAYEPRPEPEKIAAIEEGTRCPERRGTASPRLIQAESAEGLAKLGKSANLVMAACIRRVRRMPERAGSTFDGMVPPTSTLHRVRPHDARRSRPGSRQRADLRLLDPAGVRKWRLTCPPRSCRRWEHPGVGHARANRRALSATRPSDPDKRAGHEGVRCASRTLLRRPATCPAPTSQVSASNGAGTRRR